MLNKEFRKKSEKRKLEIEKGEEGFLLLVIYPLHARRYSGQDFIGNGTQRF